MLGSGAAGADSHSERRAAAGSGGSGATGTTRLGLGRAFAGAGVDAGVGGAGISVSVADRMTSSGDFGGSTGHSDHATWTAIDSASAIDSERRTRKRCLTAIRGDGGTGKVLVANVAMAYVSLRLTVPRRQTFARRE